MEEAKTLVPLTGSAVSAAEPSALVSVEEFERIQNQLLELRSQNYKLEEDNSKLANERQYLLDKLRSNEEELLKLNKTSLFRRRGPKETDALEDEMKNLRRKLATQEEEFRLQQSTLMEELNKVVRHSDELERELAGAKMESSFQDDSDSESNLVTVKAENVSLRNQLSDLKKLHEYVVAETREQLRIAGESSAATDGSSGGIEELAEAQSNIRSLESQLAEMKGLEDRNSELQRELGTLKGSLKAESEEKQRIAAEMKQDIMSLNEKFRKKQESYVQLNAEKERQYQEFRKSLDAVVEKKDAEINTLIAEMQRMKQELKTVDEFREKEQIWGAEKKSLEQDILSFRADLSELREQNEGFQIQIQETHSANDCLSAQLQGAREEVLQMQEKVETAEENAIKRKQLLDDMAEHLEALKDSHQKQLQELYGRHQEEVKNLNARLCEAEESNSTISSLRAKADDLQSRVKEVACEKEAALVELKDREGRLELLEIQTESRLEEEKRCSEEKLKELQMRLESETAKVVAELEEARKDKEICMESVGRLKQEAKDKEEQLKVVEKKHHAVSKDMKRQVASEKKRADRLQEKLQEVLTEISSRAKSPGFEEIKAADVTDGKRGHNDSGSVSSWSMLSGNNHKNETDRQSTHTNENGSDSSVTMLECENQDLVSRLTQLQKAKFELEERVQMLEESNGAMADDLVNKSAIIEQFVKDKPGSEWLAEASKTHEEGKFFSVNVAPGSPAMEKLPGGLKKVIDFVKLDQSAGDIREMNRRLQLMLEETLTKNMHLQKDLEIMSQEVSRLTELHPQEKIRKL